MDSTNGGGDTLDSDRFSSNDGTPRDDDIPVSTIKFGDLFGTRSDYSKGVFYRGKKKYLTTRKLIDTKCPDPNYNALEPPELFMTRAQTRKHKKISNLSLLKTLDFKVVNTDNDEKAKKAALIRKQEDKIKQKKNRPPSTIILEKYSSYSRSDWNEVHQAGCTFFVNKKTGEVSSEAPWEYLPEELSIDNPNPAITSAVSPGGRSSMLVNKLRTTVLASHPKGLAGAARASLAMSRLGTDSQGGGGTNLHLLEELKHKREEEVQHRHEEELAQEADEFVLDEDAEGTGSVVYDRSEVSDFFNILDATAAAEPPTRPKSVPNHSPSRTWRDK
jgi:hypothetical protein